MSFIQIQPIDPDIQEITIQVSSLGVLKTYSLTQTNNWQVELQQNLGTFAYLEVNIDGAPCCATPLSTENMPVHTWRFALDPEQIYPVAENTPAAQIQYGWGIALMLLLFSFKWNRS